MRRRHLTRGHTAEGSGTEPDLGGGAGERAEPDDPLVGEACLQLGYPDVATDPEVVVPQRNLDGDIALAEDAEAEAALVRLGAEKP